MGSQIRLGEADFRGKSSGKVLDTIIKSGPLSRTDIANRLGLARSTVSVIVNSFLQAELIREIGKKESEGLGRPPTLLEFNSTSRVFLCIDLDVGEISLILCDLEGRVIAAYVDVMGKLTPSGVASQIIASTEAFLAQEKLDWHYVAGLGIVFPGPVRHDIQSTQSLVFGWDKPVRLQDELAKQLPMAIPILIENDVKTCAYAEWIETAHPQDLLYLYVGRGIGGAYMSNGRLLHGRHFLAGEIGHMMVEHDGSVCRCGSRGCLEQYASIPHILASIWGETALNRTRNYYQSSLVDLVRQLEREEPKSLAAVERAGWALGFTLFNLVQMLDCENIVIGGPIRALENFITDSIKSCLGKHLARGFLSLTFSELGEDAKTIGMASLMRETLLLNGDLIEDAHSVSAK